MPANQGSKRRFIVLTEEGIEKLAVGPFVVLARTDQVMDAPEDGTQLPICHVRLSLGRGDLHQITASSGADGCAFPSFPRGVPPDAP